MSSNVVSTLAADSTTEESEQSESGSEDCSVADVSQKVLAGLDRAQPAAIARQRSVKLNPPGERKRRRCGPSTKLRKKSLHECVTEHPGEYLTVESGAIFCKACRTAVSSKASSLHRHIRTKRHVDGKKQRAAELKHQQSVVQSMVAYNTAVHPQGETLPKKERVFRVEVVETFLKAGVSLAKTAHFRPLLEKYATRLADRTILARLIPTVLHREKDAVKTLISGKDLSLIFDGSTRLGEAVVIVVRYLDGDWNVRQVLTRLKVLSKSQTGEQLAGELIDTLATSLQIDRRRLISVMRDGAAVNGVAVRILNAVYPKALDVRCFSHTIDRVGLHFDLPTLDQFMQWWIQLFSRSAAAKLAWRERTGTAMKSYSATRWWSKWEVMQQVMMHFGDVQPFLEATQDIAPRLNDHLTGLLTSEADRKALMMELAAVVDAGEPFVKATYNLEGDGVLVFHAYSTLQALSAAAAQRHYPNVAAQASALGNTPAEVDELVTLARNGVQPGINYFLQKFNTDLYDIVRAFRAARMACPTTVQELHPHPQDVQQLRQFPFLDDDAIIGDLQKELPTYLAEADGIRVDRGQELRWWKDHQAALPHWSSAASQLALVQPSSAAAERVFSLLRAQFDEQQGGALEDYLEAAVMLAYNHRG